MRSPGINGGELRGQPANPGSPGKMAVKTECVCAYNKVESLGCLFVTDTFEIFDFNSGATVYFLHIFNIVP